MTVTRSGEQNSNWRGGKTFHPMYGSYCEMIARCTRPSHHRWSAYGGRGIKVCKRWRASFWNFVEDMGERPTGMWLDRKNNDGHYWPSNCRWVTPSESNKNRRDSAYDGLRRANEARRKAAA